MNSKALCYAAALAVLSGCSAIFDPLTSAPEGINDLSYEEIYRLGSAKYEKDGFNERRTPWGPLSTPASCSLLKSMHDRSFQKPKSKVEWSIKDCEQRIAKEREAFTQWQSNVKQRYREWKTQQEELAKKEALERHAEEEKRSRVAEDRKQRAEEMRSVIMAKLAKTKAYPLMKNLPKKPIVFPNSQRLGLKDVGIVAGCFELGFKPSNVSYNRSGRMVEVRFANAQYPRGTMDTSFEFVENDDYWLVNELTVEHRTFNDAANLIPITAAALSAGGCHS